MASHTKLPVLLLLAALSLAAAPSPLPLEEWKGEYFAEKQGGLFVKVALNGFKATRQTKYLTGQIQIVIHNVLKKKTYVVSHAPADPEGAPRELWKLPAGKYVVRSVTMVDQSGTRRTWRDKDGEGRRTFVVRRQCLSNLGLWSLAPAGRSGLSVSFDMVPNSYREEGPKSESSVAAVLDAFTGLVQEKLGGRKVLDGAESAYEGRHLRANVTFTRQIAMFYKLDLFRHNHHAPGIAEVLGVYDPNIRRCYTDRLDDNEGLRGEVKFTFLLAKQTGTMSKLKHTGGTAVDPKLAQCLYFQLAQIQFPVPENMVGELTYTFDVQ